MDVEVTVEATKTRHVHWAYRLIETLGLIAVLYGLAASAWWIALFGAVTIFGIYALYRRRHGSNPSNGPDSAGMSDDGGGGD